MSSNLIRIDDPDPPNYDEVLSDKYHPTSRRWAGARIALEMAERRGASTGRLEAKEQIARVAAEAHNAANPNAKRSSVNIRLPSQRK